MIKNELIIGLGGQGGSSIRELRRTIEIRKADFEAIKKDDGMMEYLYIDSNDDILTEKKWSVFGHSIKLKPDEKVMLKENGSIPEIEQIVKYPNIKPWIGDIQGNFSERIKGDNVNKTLQGLTGAGQLRRYGRALFALHADKIKTKIETKLDILTTGRDNGVNVRIFCTLGGGTGSGSLIDVITLIQTIVANKGFNAKLIVYAYVGGPKAESADTGSFYLNQYCSLRDLNALIVRQYEPYLTGGGDSRNEYYQGSKTVDRIYLSSDVAPGNPDLGTQIEALTAACFDSIVYEYRHKNAGALRAISGEDLVDVTPGEARNVGEEGPTVRSYRFAVMGARRWRVPTTQIRKLLTHDIESRVWNAFLDGSELPDGASRNSSSLEGFTCNYETSEVCNEYKELRKEQLKPITDFDKIRRDEKVLEDILEASERVVDLINRLPQDPKLKIKFDGIYKLSVDRIKQELLRHLDSAITWNSAKTDVWGLEDVLKYLSAYKRTVGTWNNTSEENHDTGRIKDRMGERQKEWKKLGPLTIRCTKLPQRMIDKQIEDATALVDSAFSKYEQSIIKDFIQNVTDMLSTITSSVETFKDSVSREKDKCKTLIEKIEADLEGCGESSAWEQYEYDKNNLRELRKEMENRDFSEEMGSYSQLLKERVGKSYMVQCDSESFDNFASIIRNEQDRLSSSMAKIHHGAIASKGGALKSVLVGNIVERLFQIAGSAKDNWDNRLRTKVENFMKSLPESAAISGRDGLTEPQKSPAKALLFGFPKNSNHPEFVNWLTGCLKDSITSENTVNSNRIDFYEHETADEIRVLYLQYWFPCRFANVVKSVQEKYQKSLDNKENSRIYFANYDESGMDTSRMFKRPSLTLDEEPDAENIAMTELAKKLHLKHDGKQCKIIIESEIGIQFVKSVHKTSGPVYGDSYALTQKKNPSSSYKSDLKQAISFAVDFDDDGASYKPMTQEERSDVWKKDYIDKRNELEEGTDEWQKAEKLVQLVGGWLKVQ